MKSVTVKVIRTTVLTLVLAVVLLGALWYQGNRPARGNVDATGRGFIDSPFHNESEWIIHSILQDLMAMIRYRHPTGAVSASDVRLSVRTVGLSTPCTYEATIQMPGDKAPVSATIVIDPREHHIWSPAVYANIAREVMGRLNVGRASWKLNDRPLMALKSLLHPTLETLLNESRRVSRVLEMEMLDPYAHDNAALVIGMLAFQEAAGMWTDVRQNLNRITAHRALALAIASKPAEPTLGRLADIIVKIMIQDQAGALKDLSGTTADPAADPVLANVLSIWRDALHARITNDWRVLKAKKTLTLLEKQELFRALCGSVSSDQAVVWYESQPNDNIPHRMLAHMVGHNNDHSVGNGHVYARDGITDELTAMGNLFESVLSDKRETIDFLNRRPSGCVTALGGGRTDVAVIDRGLWGQYFQRHLVHRMGFEYDFYRNSWGRHEAAKAFLKYLDDHFKALYLYPTLKRTIAVSQAAYDNVMDAAMPLLTRHPEYYNAGQWHWLTQAHQGGAVPPGTPDRNVWFAAGLPPGTIYRLQDRCAALRKLFREKETLYAAAIEIAPFHRHVIKKYIKHCLPKIDRSSGNYSRIFGSMTEYHLYAMNKMTRLYKKDQPEKYIALKRKICAIDPSQGFGLGRYLVKQEMPEAAAEVYQHAIDHAVDAVEMANKCDWLVNYYFDTGKKDQALVIAERAAEVYSLAGLLTMARLQEKMNALDRAEAYYRKIAKRYEADGALCAFYHRYRDVPQFRAKFDAGMAKLFPKGLQKARLSDFDGAPPRGVILLGENRRMRKYHLASNNIIVAIDGYRVDNRDQYEYVRALTDDPRMHLIVWHDQQYVEVRPKLEKRLFGVNIDTYP